MSTGSPRGGRVIVVGSINVDLGMRLPRLPAAGETVLGGILTRHDGGKGANQAVAAARAGARVHMIGAVGSGDGDASVAALLAQGVGVDTVARVRGRTGHAFVLVDSGSGENQIAVAPGANDLLAPGHVDAALAGLDLGPADVIVLSFELPRAPLQAAAGAAERSGALVVINPAPARPDCDDLLTGALVTPNAGELAAIIPAAPADLQMAAVALSSRTGAPVVVTLGADGALLAHQDSVQQFAGHRVKVVDTTGAGDTLTGVLAASLAAGQILGVSLRRAVAASALAVTSEGARTAMPTAAQIDRMLQL